MDNTLGIHSSASPEVRRNDKTPRVLQAKATKPNKAAPRKRGSAPEEACGKKGKGKEPMFGESGKMDPPASDLRTRLVIQEKELKAQRLKLISAVEEMTAAKNAHSSSLVDHEILLKAHRMEGQRLSMTRVADVRHQ